MKNPSPNRWKIPDNCRLSKLEPQSIEEDVGGDVDPIEHYIRGATLLLESLSIALSYSQRVRFITNHHAPGYRIEYTYHLIRAFLAVEFLDSIPDDERLILAGIHSKDGFVTPLSRFESIAAYVHFIGTTLRDEVESRILAKSVRSITPIGDDECDLPKLAEIDFPKWKRYIYFFAKTTIEPLRTALEDVDIRTIKLQLRCERGSLVRFLRSSAVGRKPIAHKGREATNPSKLSQDYPWVYKRSGAMRVMPKDILVAIFQCKSHTAKTRELKAVTGVSESTLRKHLPQMCGDDLLRHDEPVYSLLPKGLTIAEKLVCEAEQEQK